MKKITVNGKEVNTNYGRETYPTAPDSFDLTRLPFRMSDREFLEQAVEDGYKKVTFYEETTCVRGLHHIYARCKR